MKKGSLSKKNYLSSSNLLPPKIQNQVDNVNLINIKGMVVRNDVKPQNIQLKN